MVADKPQAYCPRLEGLVPWFLINRSCLDTFELLNSSSFIRTSRPGKAKKHQRATSVLSWSKYVSQGKVKTINWSVICPAPGFNDPAAM